MPNILLTQYHDLGTGVVADIELTSGYNAMLIYGTAAGATSVITSGIPPVADMDFVIYWDGDSGANACTVLGVAMPTGMSVLPHYIRCHYNAVTSAWEVDFLPSVATAFLTNAMISATANIARAKLAVGTADWVLRNNGLGLMSEEQFLNQVRGGLGADVSGFTGVLKVVAGTFSAAAILNADISAVAGIALTKLAAATANRAAAFGAAGFLEPSVTTLTELSYLSGATSNLQAQIDAMVGIQSFDVTIPTSNVLNLFAVPAQLVGAQGAGLGIELISCTASMSYAGVAYAVSGDLLIKCTTASKEQAYFTAARFLFGTVTRTISAFFSVITGAGATDTMIVANDPLIAQVSTANPTLGSSDINIKGLYRIISVP